MFKTDFYKTIYGGRDENGDVIYYFKKASGWGECLEAPDGTPVEIRLEKQDETWRALEESSGLFLDITGTTRQEAINAVTAELLQVIADKLKSEYCKNIIEKLSDYIMTAGR